MERIRLSSCGTIAEEDEKREKRGRE